MNRIQQRQQQKEPSAWRTFGWRMFLPENLAAEFLLRSGGALRQWWQERKATYLVQGLPALLIAGVVVAVGTAATFTAKDGLASRYEQEAQRACQAGDYAVAKTCYERLVLWETNRKQTSYGLALTLEATGNHERASALMAELAPIDAQGYAGAHYWQALRLWIKRSEKPGALRDAEIHLRWALQAEPENPDGRALLSQVYLDGNQLDLAESQLRKVAAAKPEWTLALAGIQLRLGKNQEAHTQASIALQSLRLKLEAEPDNHEACLNCAEALSLLGKHTEAVKLLQHRLELTEAPFFHHALARVYTRWLEATEKDPNAAAEDRFALLERGLLHDPSYLPLIYLLIDHTRKKGENADRSKAVLEKLLVKGDTPATMHLLLGMVASEAGRTSEARAHYELAYKLAPRMPVIANNLAWLLCHSCTPEMLSPLVAAGLLAPECHGSVFLLHTLTTLANQERALELINSALASDPNRPEFHYTRGMILAALGRAREALIDLEGVLKYKPTDRRLHQVIAGIYDHLHVDALAEHHKRLAREVSP